MPPAYLKSFRIQDIDLPEKDYGSREELINIVSITVFDLLAKDMEKLMSILYRLDVDETRFKKVLSSSDPSAVHLKVAELIVDREIKKMETRKKFRSKPH